MPVRICILETDILVPELAELYEGYGAMFIRLFAQVPEPVECTVFNVVEGDYPSDDMQFDAYLVTGSKADSFADDPWILRLKTYVQERYARGDKLLGICFGHQLLALALGGIAERAKTGWGLGVQRFEVAQGFSWQNPPLQEVTLIVSHQDQVTALPPTAQCLAYSRYCPNAAFVVGDQVLCFQGHPEFVADYANRLLIRRQSAFSAEQYETAVASLEQPHQGELIAQWMVNFAAEPRKH
ncbi:amidotransferase [Pseudomonas asuensis]|uniref:Amidotransferase n=1 Tax=Pseudomonas asuensis TaxID=1825787 RepID=A0ABQ2GX66_9PSED|nr:amidotransferase [Pseudomonas asuensis]GGM16186.1 amidotransferase [Pseudomonas asuensis]